MMPVRVLLLTYSFPPAASAEAFVAAKALGGLQRHGFDVTVLTIRPETFGMAREDSLLPYVRDRFSHIHYISAPAPLELGRASTWLRRAKVFRLARIPDPFLFTNALFTTALKAWPISEYDVLVTRSPVHAIHLVGRKLKARHPSLRWLAHFSDPWADNPYDSTRWWERRLNRALERRVIDAADLITVTSRETQNLVFKKYSPAVLDRVAVIPHAYDPVLYPQQARQRSVDEPITIRCLGTFYGKRVPDVLLNALRRLTARSPHLLARVRFEFYARFLHGAARFSHPSGLPPGLWNAYAPVDYLTSLQLMQEADGLLSIDAPFAPSVFLPSKLVDYVGARRPILTITPPGTAAELTRSLGGWVSDPRDAAEVDSVLVRFVEALRRQRDTPGLLCEGSMRHAYSLASVSEALAGAIQSKLFAAQKRQLQE
jgi:glycosyltransferase involved in cell wall biosynthesis